MTKEISKDVPALLTTIEQLHAIAISLRGNGSVTVYRERVVTLSDGSVLNRQPMPSVVFASPEIDAAVAALVALIESTDEPAKEELP